MAEHAIERRLIGGVWQTVDVEEDTGGGSPDLAAVLAEGGDPEDNPITGPVTINLAGQPNIAGLLVIDHNGRPILGISGAGIGEPTLGGVPTLHSDEHGVTVSLDGLSQGFLVMARTGDVPFKVAATGAVTIARRLIQATRRLPYSTRLGSVSSKRYPTGTSISAGLTRGSHQTASL